MHLIKFFFQLIPGFGFKFNTASFESIALNQISNQVPAITSCNNHGRILDSQSDTLNLKAWYHAIVEITGSEF